MDNQPFYHLRPNKYIDRQMFVDTLINLNKFLHISDYTYIGFGSFMFDDFKLIHQKLNIQKMFSVEHDNDIHQRAINNKPYSCIELVNKTSTDFISSFFPSNEHVIIWLDYTSPSEIATQFSDIGFLLPNLNKYDILRITLNANPKTLLTRPQSPEKTSKMRLSELKKRIPDFIPNTIKDDDMAEDKYPITLLRALQKAAHNYLSKTPFSKKYLYPIYSTVYKDGQQMVVLTAIVLDMLEDEQNIKNTLANIPQANFTWDNPAIINVPLLTEKEAIEIDQILPCKNAKNILKKNYSYLFDGIDKKQNRTIFLESYINYYKYYPHFHSVNF
jgi:hypothetical protein